MNTESTQAEQEHICRKEDKIPLKEQILYGIGDVFGGGQAAFLSVCLLAFFTDIIGIAAGIASTIIMLSKIWDSVSDPAMGLISENTRRFKMGRRRPYMIIGGCLIPFALAFLFAPVGGFAPANKAVWMAFAYICYCTVSTISQVPYMSMASDISMDYKERNKANTWKLIFDIVGGGVLYLVPSLIWNKVIDGSIAYMQFYFIIIFGFGLLFGVPLVISGLSIKERAPYIAEEKVKFKPKEYFKGLSVKSYLLHITMYVCAFLAMDIVSATAIYYANYIGSKLNGAVVFSFLGDFGKMGPIWIIAPMMVCAGVGIVLAYVLKAKFNKQTAYRFGIPVYVVGAVLLACYNESWNAPYLIPVFSALMGLGFAGAQSMPWLIFPDTVDVAELKLGYRPTANMSGVMTFARKFCTAIGVGMVGWIIGACGYVSPLSTEQSDMVLQAQNSKVLLAIRLILAVSVGILLTVGFVASLLFKVTDKKLDRVRYFVEKRRTEGETAFTEEEKAEYIALKRELC